MPSVCAQIPMRGAAGWLLLVAGVAEAQPAVRHILVLQSFNRGNLVLDSFTANFLVDLEGRAEAPLNVVQVVVGPTGFVVAPEQAIVDYIRATFVNQPPPELIVTIGGPAATFARRHRQQIFPERPLLLASVDQQYLRDATLGENETAVTVVNDFPQLVDDILQLLPETQADIHGDGPWTAGHLLASRVRRPVHAISRPADVRLVRMICPSRRSCGAVRTCHAVRRSSIITLITDSQGGAYADERVLAELHATANAPLFGKHTVTLGHGVVGGRLVSIEELRRTTADAAVRLLDGAPPGSVRVPPHVAGQPIFDWRELQRWGIAESRLPAGSAVRYRNPTLWQEYRGTVLTAAGVLAVQSILIAGLLHERRARQRAEMESRRNLSLAADASRRQTMSALTSAIAHELGQPLSSMIHNAQALELMITADRATPDTISEILADIKSQGVHATQIIDRHRTMLRSRQLDKKPIDLHAVISESLALVAHDMRARQIEATLQLSSNPCVINGDQVLLQQVLVNLLINAMDAMGEVPPARRRVRIGTSVRGAEVELSVRDTGAGLPADIDGALFAPFVTTKPQGIGMGLTIVQTIVDAHSGTLTAHNNPEGGATFTVTLPRSAARPDSGQQGAA